MYALNCCFIDLTLQEPNRVMEKNINFLHDIYPLMSLKFRSCDEVGVERVVHHHENNIFGICWHRDSTVTYACNSPITELNIGL